MTVCGDIIDDSKKLNRVIKNIIMVVSIIIHLMICVQLLIVIVWRSQHFTHGFSEVFRLQCYDFRRYELLLHHHLVCNATIFVQYYYHYNYLLMYSITILICHQFKYDFCDIIQKYYNVSSHAAIRLSH